MDDGSITMIAALAVLVALSAFFSASETAFSSLNQIRVKSRAEDGDPSAKRVLAMSQQYDKLLSTILIGNNIVNIASASLGTLLFTAHFGPEYGATLSTIVMTLVVLIFGEITPKSLAKEVPERLASAVAPALQLLMTVLTRAQAQHLRRFVRRHDPHAFITIVNSSEIVGKGFRSV